MACSVSATVQRGAWPTAFELAGLCTTKCEPSAAFSHLPPISACSRNSVELPSIIPCLCRSPVNSGFGAVGRSLNHCFEQTDQRLARAIVGRQWLQHDSARCACFDADPGRSGDDNTGELVQLSDRLRIDRTRMGNRRRRQEESRHDVGRFGVRVFAPVVLEARDRQVVRGEGGAVEENDAFFRAHLPKPKKTPNNHTNTHKNTKKTKTQTPAPISAFICCAISAA